MIIDYIDGFRYEYTINKIIKNDRKYKISVIIVNNCFYNTYFTLRTIDDTLFKDVQIIIIDIQEDKRFNVNYLENIKLDTVYIKIFNKTWINNDIEYNIGMKYAEGDIFILQTGNIIHVDDVIKYTSDFYDHNKNNYNSVLVFPILELIRKKDNKNLIFNLYKQNNKEIKDIISKDHSLFKNKRSARYISRYFDNNIDNNFLIVIHKRIIDMVHGFDNELCLYKKKSINMFFYKLQYLTHTDIIELEFTKYYNENYPYGIQLYYEKEFEEPEIKPKKNKPIKYKSHKNMNISEYTKDIIDMKRMLNQYINSIIYNAVDIVDNNKKFVSLINNTYKNIEPENKISEYDQLIKNKYEQYKKTYYQNLLFSNNHIYDDNLIKLYYHQNTNYSKNKFDFGYNKKMLSLFDEINYNGESFNYTIKKNIEDSELRRFSNQGIYFTIYPHKVDDKWYKISFKCKACCDNIIDKRVGINNSRKLCVLKEKLTREYQNYELEFQWINKTDKLGQPKKKYYISIHKIECGDSFSIKDIVLLPIEEPDIKKKKR